MPTLFCLCSRYTGGKTEKDKKRRQEDKTNQTETPKEAGPPSLTIDWEFYAKDLDDSDASDAEKQQYLEAFWSIIVSLVDLGFGIHPVLHACENSCEQSAEIRAFIAAECATVVSSPDTLLSFAPMKAKSKRWSAID